MGNVLVEGAPGSGKTTLALRVLERLETAGVGAAGFTTSEVRKDGHRVGFVVEAIGGPREWLAHVDFPKDVRVGRYGVDLEALERVALPAMTRPGADVVVVDELGKMEVASSRFRDSITAILDGPATVLATVHVRRHPFTDAIKRRPEVVLFRLTPRNRDRLVDEVIGVLRP